MRNRCAASGVAGLLKCPKLLRVRKRHDWKPTSFCWHYSFKRISLTATARGSFLA